MEFYKLTAEQTLKNFDIGLAHGLSKEQLNKNIQTYGKNIIKENKKVSNLARFFNQFKNFMIIILLVSAVINIVLSITSKEYTDLIEGITILIIVIINSIIGVIQEKKADDAIEMLKNKTISTVRVWRDGQIVHVLATEITMGDLLLIETGDIMPADLRVIENHNLFFNESMITGESKLIEKHSNAIQKENLIIADQKNILFAGSVCVRGRGLAVVIRVGEETELGKIAKTIKNKKKELTPLQKSIDKIGSIISWVVLSIVVVIFLLAIFAQHMSIFDALMMSIAIAVAAVPESLPAVITVIMALGVQTLAKRKVIIRHLHAVETLGSCNVICTDKTGTITENKMKVKRIFSFGQNSQMSVDLISKCCIMCGDVYASDEGISGDPTEIALYNYAVDNGIDVFSLLKNSKRIDEKQFDSTRKMMSVKYLEDKNKMVYVKGATDKLLTKCNRVLIGTNIVELTTDLKNQILMENTEMGCKALRVLSMAYKIDDDNEMENNLIYLGLIGMLDPARKEVGEAVKKCFRAGLKPVMITGDHKETAFAIAKEVGISNSADEIITGEEIERMTDEELKNNIHKYSIFARVSPEHKMRIVNAFRNIKQIVAMTGDGVNDAGSLSVANIGVGMGIAGTDVIKSVADMIITDDNFASIVVAIEEGRKVYANIQKSIQFLLSTNIVEVVSIFFVLLFYKQNAFLLPVQILFINLVTDSLPAFALGVEKTEKAFMERPPRKNSENIFGGGMGKNIIIQGIIQSVIVLTLYVLTEKFYTPDIATTMVFYTIIFMQLLHSINVKSNDSLFEINIFNNRTFNLCFVITLIMNLFVVFVPCMQSILGLYALNVSQWTFVIIASVAVIPLVEVSKLFKNKKILTNFDNML